MPIMFEPVPEWLQDELALQVGRVLTELCISESLDGYHYFAYSIVLNIQDPERVRYITKELYPDCAIRFHTTVARVERSMRTAVKACWKQGGAETLDRMVGYHLIRRPTNSQFIKFVTGYMRRR